MFKRILIVFTVLFIVFILSLKLVGLIPSGRMNSTIGESIKALKREGLYPSVGLPHRQIVLDNFTDALILNTSYSFESGKPFESLITNKRYSLENTTNQITSLEEGYKHKTVEKVGYERYWHGYLIYLRPLLTLFSYSELRILLFFLLYISFVAFIFLSKQKLGSSFAIASIISFFAIDFFYLGYSLQFSPVFMIGLLGGMYVLKKHKSTDSLLPFFFIIGGLTAFFDLLTAPLISLSIPLVVAIKLYHHKIGDILRLCIFWMIGYTGLWASKWVLAEATFSPHTIQTAIYQLLNRTIHKADMNFSHLGAVKLNLFQLIGYDSLNKKIVVLIFILSFLFFVFFNKISRDRVRRALPWIFVAIIPYCWYLIVANHSYLHVWFTYRIQFISVFGFIMGAGELIDWNRFKKTTERIRTFLFPKFAK